MLCITLVCSGTISVATGLACSASPEPRTAKQPLRDNRDCSDFDVQLPHRPAPAHLLATCELHVAFNPSMCKHHPARVTSRPRPFCKPEPSSIRPTPQIRLTLGRRGDAEQPQPRIRLIANQPRPVQPPQPQNDRDRAKRVLDDKTEQK